MPTTVLGTVLGPWRQRAGDRGSCPQEVHSVSKIFLKNFLRGHVKENILQETPRIVGFPGGSVVKNLSAV